MYIGYRHRRHSNSIFLKTDLLKSSESVISKTSLPNILYRFLENTAGEKAQKIINKLLEFREQEKKRLEENLELTLGDVTTVNLTLMEGGVQVKL